MKHFVSPSFSSAKLEPPLFKDVVDVFEDRMRYWLIEPAKKLLPVRHGEVAAARKENEAQARFKAAVALKWSLGSLGRMWA